MSNSKPLISVILPVRNGNIKLFNRALSSVLGQSYTDFELLIIDDGSSESFARKLDDISSQDGRIRLFHTAPSGVSAARNFAVKQAKGDIITYIDGDDAISPRCFEEAASVLNDSSIDAVWGGTVYVKPEEMEELVSAASERALTKRELKKYSLHLDKRRIHKTRSECIGAPYRFGRNGYINRGIAARFIKKSLFDDKDLHFPEGIRMYEDTIWNLRMMKYRVCYVKRVWYYYLNNDASVSNRFNPGVLKDIEIPLKKIRRMLELDDDIEYAAYTRFLIDSLRYVYKCLYGHPKWKPDSEARKKALSHIYKDMPWKEIGSKRFFKAAVRSDRIKAILYRYRLLFAYWKYTWKKM